MICPLGVRMPPTRYIDNAVKHRSPVVLLSNTVRSGASRRQRGGGGGRRSSAISRTRRGAHCRSNITRRGDRSASLLTRRVATLISTHASGMVNASARVGIAERSPLARVSERGHRSRTGRGRVGGLQRRVFGSVRVGPCCVASGRLVRRVVALRGQASTSALLLALLLPGCTVGPDYSREPAPVPSTFKELKGWKLANPNDAADRGNWWAPYKYFRLATLLREVEISNQTVAAAAAAYEQSRAIVREAQAALFPTAAGSYSVTRTRTGALAGTTGGSGVGFGLGTRYTTQYIPQSITRLGPRRLGQSPAHHRSQRVVGAGQRRRPRQRQTVGASPTRHRVFQPARGRFAALPSPASLRRAVPRAPTRSRSKIQSRLRPSATTGQPAPMWRWPNRKSWPSKPRN